MAKKIALRLPRSSPTRKLTRSGQLVFVEVLPVKRTDTTTYAAQCIRTNDNARHYIIWVVELTLPVFVLKNTTENTLIITEQDEGQEAC